jgi:hypothetical protein
VFLSSLNLCNTSLFLTESIQLISILLQHHNSRLHRYILCTFRSVQVSTTHKPVLQMQHLSSFFLTFQSNLLVITFILLLSDWCFCHDNPGFNLTCLVCIICDHPIHAVEMLHYPVVSDL